MTKSTFTHDTELHHFLDTVLEVNRTMNMTSVRDPKQAWNKHIVDSLHGLQTGLFDNPVDPETSVRVIDIGTGAGFPGMPLALEKPEIQLTLLDSTAKKCAFLDSYINDQNLAERIKVLLGRAEEWAHSHLHRAQYDVAITRALGSFSEVCELTLPFVKKDGHAILWRGKDAPEETQQGAKVLSTLCARLVSCESYQLPGHELDYHLVVLRKANALPGRYPRKVGIPKKLPLE
ncbi:MAG: 16S rRNA (guanine(527)-N(7))-methyltransferase RsmG [Abditibacteriaceae bacterium]